MRPKPPIQRILAHGLLRQEAKEARLQRLEELLRQRSEAIKRQPIEHLKRRDQRSGFSLVELLIVLVIILILIGLSLNSFMDSMKRAAVDQAAADILAASDTARQLSLQANGIGEVHYGVRLRDDPSTATATATVVRLEGGAVTVAAGVDDQPLYEAKIPASVVLWQGDADLRSASETELLWFFGNGSGKVRMQEGTGLSTYPVGVGTDALRVERIWGMAENTGFVPAIAPNVDTTPGLSVRSSDNRYRVAISVQPNGVGMRNAFGDLADE